jgi:tetratricopeptide (TPR) repeat protein
MIRRILPTILLALLFVTPVVAQKIDPPKLTPTPATESQAALIKKGVALHDRGDYDGAIAKYEQVLRENPSNDWALYELAFSYEMKKDYRKGLETAYKGAQYKSDLLGACRLKGLSTLSNCYSLKFSVSNALVKCNENSLWPKQTD